MSINAISEQSLGFRLGGHCGCSSQTGLGKGHDIWPVTREGSATMTPAQLSMLLEGIDWRMPVRTWQPEAAG